MNTHHICFHGETREILSGYSLYKKNKPQISCHFVFMNMQCDLVSETIYKYLISTIFTLKILTDKPKKTM